MIAQQLANLTKKISVSIEALEASFAPALTGAVPTGFFNQKIAEISPIIADCVKAKLLVPPGDGLVKKSQFSTIEDKLREFSTEIFPVLEVELNVYLTSPEPSTKATALGKIAKEVPGIITNYISMKSQMKKVKEALRV